MVQRVDDLEERMNEQFNRVVAQIDRVAIDLGAQIRQQRSMSRDSVVPNL